MRTDELLAIVARADELYRQRATPGVVRESVMVLSGARGESDRYEVQWRLSRAMFFLGETAESPTERRQMYEAGITAGQQAIALNEDRVEGHFWAGVNLALFAENNRGLRGIRALRWARSELRRAIAIRESYHDAGPLRVLARLEHKAPRWLGADRRRARKYLERALEIAPRNCVTLRYAAELELDLGSPREAARLLHRLLSAPEDPEWECERQRDAQYASEILDKLERTDDNG
jgi:tetratricopeptide (TPR) repeat protein